MTAYKGANMTKYDAGGSGDNVIADGYIKTVEKVWIETYTIPNVALSTADTLAIASIPPNKKITGCDVTFSALTPTTSTINVGTAADPDAIISEASTVAISADGVTPAGITRVSMNVTVLPTTTSTTNTVIYLSIGTVAMTAPTNGTIITKVMYT